MPPPTDLTPSQALDILESQEMIPDTKMFHFEQMIVSENNDDNDNTDSADNVNNDVNDDENGMRSMECKQFERGYDDANITHKSIPINTTTNPLLFADICKWIADISKNCLTAL